MLVLNEVNQGPAIIDINSEAIDSARQILNDMGIYSEEFDIDAGLSILIGRGGFGPKIVSRCIDIKEENNNESQG